jgi:hypothetical protein
MYTHITLPNIKISIHYFERVSYVYTYIFANMSVLPPDSAHMQQTPAGMHSLSPPFSLSLSLEKERERDPLALKNLHRN